LTKSEDIIAGSVRSVSGFDVYQALEACKDSIIQFGGHKYAAGLTLNPEQIDLFRSAFEAYTKESILPDQREPSISYDLEISFKDLNFKLLRILNQMAPFGPKNMRPIFATHQCKDAGGSRLVGSNKKHLRFDIIDSFGDRFSGIGFDMGQYIMEIKKQKPFSILYNIEENQYNGNTSLQLKVKNIKF
jgi:single-stranded-DNA-specific exonuclease